MLDMPTIDHSITPNRIEDNLKQTPNRWRSHVDARADIRKPIANVWQRMLRTEDYHSWLGHHFGPLPDRFNCGTKIQGGVIGECKEGYNLQLYYEDRLLVLELCETKLGANLRVCIDTFFSTQLRRMLASTKRQISEAQSVADAFARHCESGS